MTIRGLKNMLHFGTTGRLRNTKDTIRQWRPEREHYSVVIASETDARKRTYGFDISRRALIAASAAAVLVVAAFAGMTLFSVIDASYYSAKANELKGRVLTQSSKLDTYAGEINTLSSELNDWRQDFKPSGTGE